MSELDALRVLSRKDLAELGYPRTVSDAIFRDVPNIAVPGSSRRLIFAADFERYLREHTYSGDRMR